jgi:hypothetical protein
MGGLKRSGDGSLALNARKKEEKSEISLLPVLERVGKYVPSDIRTLG